MLRPELRQKAIVIRAPAAKSQGIGRLGLIFGTVQTVGFHRRRVGLRPLGEGHDHMQTVAGFDKEGDAKVSSVNTQ